MGKKYNLTTRLQQFLQKSINPLQDTDFIMRKVGSFRDLFYKQPRGPQRAKFVHETITSLINDYKSSPQNKWNNIQCKAGCSSCCNLLVSITTDESDLLAEVVEKENIPVNLEKLKIQSEVLSHLDWLKLSRENRSCVFLKDDGYCGVYENRPASCRKHFALSSPVICADDNGKMTHLSMMDVEFATSAAQDLDPAKGLLPLAKSLYERIKK